MSSMTPSPTNLLLVLLIVLHLLIVIVILIVIHSGTDGETVTFTLPQAVTHSVTVTPTE